MILVASDVPPFVKSGNLHAVMLDGTKRVHCIVTRDALSDAAARIGIYDISGREIELLEDLGNEFGEAADRKYSLGQVEPDGTVVITTADLNA